MLNRCIAAHSSSFCVACCHETPAPDTLQLVQTLVRHLLLAAAVRQLDIREAGGGQRQLLQLARNGVKLEINSISSPW
jgi:hypothetical protein